MKVGIVDCGNIFKNRAFKALVSIVLLLLVLSKVDLAAFVKTIIKTNLLIFILSFLMLLAQQCLTAYAWSLALNSQSRKISFMRVIQAHFIGAFGGTFLPSSVGIDVIRAYYLYRNTSNGIEAISSIFLCRVIGLLVFFFTVIVVSMSVGRHSIDANLMWMVWILLVLFVGSLLVLFNETFNRHAERILIRLKRAAWHDKIKKFHIAINNLLKNKYVLLKLISIIFIYQNCGIIAIYLIGASLNVSVPLVYYFIFCPLISIISLLPVSIAGIGVREGGFVYFFTRVGASKPEALSIALLLFFEAICMALIGGILYWAAGASSAGMATHKQNSLAMPEK